ncbi:MAG: SRPBCC domain-containing protein [Pseudomonadota bacterium]
MLTATKPSLTINRRLKVPPARVYAAWTDPQQLVKWFGPPGQRDMVTEADVRVGGRYMIRSYSIDSGEKNQVGGVYREVVPDRKLVFTWAWHSMPERESLVTLEFKPDGDGTLLTLHHEQFFDEPARDRHNQGWNAVLVKLETYLHTAGETPHGKFVWNELNTHDVEAAKRFLGTTLGWTFEAMPMPTFTYWSIRKGDERVGGIFDMNAEPRCAGVPEHWMSYVAVDDVDARLKMVRIAGGKEIRAPFDVPGVGRIAIVQQPGGAALAMITPKPI